MMRRQTAPPLQGAGVACPWCMAPQVLFALPTLVAGYRYAVWYCSSCRLGWTLPQPDEATLHKLHSTQYYRNGEGVRFYRPIEWLVEGMRRWRVARLTRYVGPGQVLDFGCGSGRFLRAMRRAGWDVAGLELNNDTATSARAVHGLDVQTSLAAFPIATYDLITLTHVLEHVRDPVGMLADCTALLRPGGVIAVAVPNILSWQARCTRGNWFHLDLPRHLWHFSEQWLLTALHELGFRPMAVRRLDLAHNIFGWLQSLLNALGLRHNCLYVFLAHDDLETGRRGHFWHLALSTMLCPLLLPLAGALALAEATFHAGGTVEVIARSARAE